MFAAWGRFVHRRRWPVLAVSALLLVASGWIAASGARLQSGGFIETSDSGRASRLIEHELPTAGGATFTLVFSSDRLTVTDAAFGDAVGEALLPLREDPRVATIVSPFIVLALFKDYGVGGVLGLMIGLLLLQIVVVAIWGIETNRRGLEELQRAPA